MPSSSSSSSTTTTNTNPSSGKTKRKRISRACDQCFQKKDRCDGLQPLCTFCSQLGRTCTYDRPERKRGPTQGLRPRLEQRILTLETILGFILSHNPNVDVLELKQGSESKRGEWRESWLTSKMRSELEEESGLADDLGLPSNATGLGGLGGIGKKEKKEQEVEEEIESDFSELDLSLPPTHLPPQNPPSQETETDLTEANNDHRDMPQLSSGIGGSSLNRGLVPRGADPNAALGGFEIQFGGNDQDEDWVRRFVPPSL